MNAVIRAISGPLRGAIFRLGEEEVSIGRQPTNHLCIGDVSVSRQHCVIIPDKSGYKIKDLNSHNGTLVNGNPVSECSLSLGDQVTVGDTVFEFLDDVSGPDLPTQLSETETVASLRIQASGQQPRVLGSDASRAPEQDSIALAAVATIGKLLNSAHDLEHLAVEIMESVCGFVACERAAMFMARRGDWFALGWDERKGRCEAAFAKREIVDQAFRQGTFIVTRLPNLSSGVMAIPLIIRGAIGGVIYLERNARLGPFAGSDLDFVTNISNYVAIALDYLDKLQLLEAENRRMRDEVQIQHKMVGEGLRMQEIYKRIARIAPTDATVLIRGETGTGKELAARAIHDNSPRAGRPFEPINCALLKGDLLESELFGHEKGAFTGAVTQKKGKLEIADAGTVFLDEIGELPEAPQSMLLRVLQEHAFERLGGTTRIQVDIRIIAATNKNLEDAVRTNKFREDLYYRLNVVSVNMVPLRERRDDIPLLAQHFLRRTSKKNNRIVTGISPDAMAYLQAYDWPGNVRELENAIEHGIVFGATDQVMPEDLPDAILARTPQAAVPAINYQDAIRRAKKQIVLDALQQAKGDHSKAAKLLHIHPNNLYRLLRDLDVKAQAHASKSG